MKDSTARNLIISLISSAVVAVILDAVLFVIGLYMKLSGSLSFMGAGSETLWSIACIGTAIGVVACFAVVIVSIMWGASDEPSK